MSEVNCGGGNGEIPIGENETLLLYDIVNGAREGRPPQGQHVMSWAYTHWLELQVLCKYTCILGKYCGRVASNDLTLNSLSIVVG
jgi:hypothetical protein